MRSWYVISGIQQVICEFISINHYHKHMWLKSKGISFKILFNDMKDHNYAKRGEEIRVMAQKGKNIKPCKIVFK